MSSGSRFSIPNNARKLIQNIKEIARNHSDDEIYAMLKECSMDPNETAQKLLVQDTFHEVKRKRDKRKENLNSKEPVDSKWRTGTQGRGGRGGRENYSPRYVPRGGKNASASKENGLNQGTGKGVTSSSLPASQDAENKVTTPVARSSIHGRAFRPAVTVAKPPEENSAVDIKKLGGAPLQPPPPVDAISAPVSEIGVTRKQPTISADHFMESMTSSSVSGIYSSASDPVLVPSIDSRLPGVVGTIKREVGSQRTVFEPNATIPVETESSANQDFVNRFQIKKLETGDVTDSEFSLSMNEKAASETGNSFSHGKIPSKSQGVERNELSESSQPHSSSTHPGSLASRPPSNYSNRSQQFMGPQKVGPSKEWKPKPTTHNPAHASGTAGATVVMPTTFEANMGSLPALSASGTEEATSKLQKKLEELHVSDRKHVIIPNHLQVPEAERMGLSFGSFDANFGVSTSYDYGSDSNQDSIPPSDSSQEIEENVEEPYSSSRNASPTAEEEGYPDHPQSPVHVPESLPSGETDGSTVVVPEYEQSKLETALPQGGPQYSVVHTAPNYGLGFMPPTLGSQLSPFESSETQARDASRLPSFVVQQPLDPSTSYYTQFYRPSTDGDGRFSPFLAPGAATKYNGNIAVLSPQTGQSPQEGGNSLVHSTAGPTPLATQSAGVMQNSIAVTQQPVPVFRQPSGVHISHYPPNYIPYNQYFSPFYVPPPTIHHFLSNAAFPQQPPAGNVYPPAAAAATNIKYSLAQFKPGTNTGNSAHVGLPTGYGLYSSSPVGYSASPAVTTGNSTGNEDIAASQFKENSVYISGQQSEGSAVWLPAPGRDISGLPASSFYSLPPQGQHVAFTPTQASHGAFAGIYHPTQTVTAATVHPLLQQSQAVAGAVEMVGPPAGVYQQPQRAQINWTNNY